MMVVGRRRSPRAVVPVPTPDVPPAPAAPTFSLIVSVRSIHPGLRRSVEAMQNALAGVAQEIIVATRTPWHDAPDGVCVAAFDSASSGDRLDRAVELASADVLAFVDERVRLSPAWAGEIIRLFSDPTIAIAGGPIMPRTRWRAERISAIIMSRHLGDMRGGPVTRNPAPRAVRELAGSNMAIRTSVFRAAGGFQSPSPSGESVRLCYKVRTLLGHEIVYHPGLALHATPRRFPRAFLREMSARGRTRGDLSRRLPEAAPLLPYALPTLLLLAIAGNAALVPVHRVPIARIGALVLLSAYLIQAVRTLTAKGRLVDRVLACIAFPLVPVSYGWGFLRGYLGRNQGEISPPKEFRAAPRVLIFNWRDVTHPWSGGAETYMHELGRRWVNAGVEVGWVTQRHAGSRRFEVIDGIRIHRIGGRFTLYPLIALVYLLRLRRKYDILVDCENGIPFFTPLFSRHPRVLVVHHVHQEVFRQALPRPLRWLALWLEGWLVPRVYRRTPIVAVSASTRDDLLRCGFDEERISVIHNGVAPPGRTRPTGPADRPRILCAGRLMPQKCVDILIRAMPGVLAAVPGAELDIVGQGPDRARLERLAWSLGLTHKIRFHGYVSAQVRDELAARAWLAVCPSVFEGWGVVCMEASARGLPVVAADVPGLRDSVRDGVTGLLVPHGDPAALAQTVIELLADPMRRHNMGVAGRDWAAQHTWERSAAQFIELLAGELPVPERELIGLRMPVADAAAGSDELAAVNAG